MPKRESLYHRHPEHRVDVEPNPERVRAVLGGTVVADSRHTVVVRETRHEPVIYFPRADVRLDLARRTDHLTFCPFKGDASYWSFRSGDETAENAAWSYEDPFPEVAELEGRIAFYPDAVELRRETEG